MLSELIENYRRKHKKSEEFWNYYRTDSLTKRGKIAYVFLDSIETLTDKESEQLSNLLDKLRND